jgi:hypothetical protein
MAATLMTSAAEAARFIGILTAALKRCATQNPATAKAKLL